MARLTQSLARHIGWTVVGIHALMLPLLYFGVYWTVRSSHEDIFVNHVRTYSKTLAQEIETSATNDEPGALIAILDSLALGGEVTFAEVQQGDRAIRSTLLGEKSARTAPIEDYAFGKGDDRTYYVSTIVQIASAPATLRLGFDETPTLEGISDTRKGVLWVLIAYTATIMMAAMIFSHYLARPLRDLRSISKRIASGDFSQQLNTPSSIQEVSELTVDLEKMRSELVGISARLEREMTEQSALKDKLRQKQRLETVGTLAGGVAHEFNNILVPITLYTELALDGIGPDHMAHADLQRVMSAVKRATNVVNKILAFSRNLDSKPSRPVDITAAVEEGVRLFSALRPANIEVALHMAQPCETVLADSTLIVQVVMNLCTNAYQAMQETGGKLTVSLHGATTLPPDVIPGRYVELSVADTGHGMDDATKDRIFEPFFTSRDVGQGNGLGLSVVHGIIVGMGATIHVASTPGSGSMFRVLIPVVDASAEESGVSNA
jgi:signal transduction histidine kinase